MTLRLFITPRAAREIRRAAEWWSVNRLDAPGAVRTDLKATLAVLREPVKLALIVGVEQDQRMQVAVKSRTRVHWTFNASTSTGSSTGSTTGCAATSCRYSVYGMPVEEQTPPCSGAPMTPNPAFEPTAHGKP